MILKDSNVKKDIKVEANLESEGVMKHYTNHPDLRFKYGIVRVIGRTSLFIDLYDNSNNIIKKSVEWSIPHAYAESWFLIYEEDTYSIDEIIENLNKLEEKYE